MKKIKFTIIFPSVLFIIVLFIELNLYQLNYNKNKQESEETLKLAHCVIENQDGNGTQVDNSTQGDFTYTKFITELKNNFIKDNVSKIIDSGVKLNSKEDEENIVGNMDIIGILKIPKLQVEAPIKDGTSQEVMRTSVGHFTESDYWDGNVSFASHNSGTSAHYFEKIDTLDIGDEIEYITKLGTRRYKVQAIQQIENTDWSMVMKVNDESEKSNNTITLITCINKKPNYRLCVRGIEI